MTWRVVPHPRLRRSLIGRTARLRCVIETAVMTIPAGTIGRITDWSPRGGSFEAAPCRCCRVAARVTRLRPEDFELVVRDREPGPRQLDIESLDATRPSP